ncbi:hypothetical protein ISS37_00640 [candidate division KSB1 bacterium]|nr:hypothetical protein [candidate division KSB1 bacterium]
MSKKVLWVILFAIAMGYLEAAVVVYLRDLFYPQGFAFPLQAMPATLVAVELGRELATLVMLVAIGVLCGRDMVEKLAYFLLSFGLWDIFYYVFLKMILGWPSSFFTWDILFLIPVPWIGPVLAPMIVSLFFIGGGLAVILLRTRGFALALTRVEWTLLGLAALAIVLSFIINYRLVLDEVVPTAFPWFLYFPGLLLGLGVFLRTLRKGRVPIEEKSDQSGVSQAPD